MTIITKKMKTARVKLHPLVSEGIINSVEV